MALPSWLLVSVGGRRTQCSGPSPILGSLGPHQRHHKFQVSLRGPPYAHGVSGTPHEEVCDNLGQIFVVSNKYFVVAIRPFIHHSGSISFSTSISHVKNLSKILECPLSIQPTIVNETIPKCLLGFSAMVTSCCSTRDHSSIAKKTKGISLLRRN